MIQKSELVRQLKGDEGIKPHVYNDHLGFATIGIGRLVDSRKTGSGLRPDEMELMLANDIADRITQLSKRISFITKLDEARQGVLLNMSFQLGVDGLLGFKNTLNLIERGDYHEASKRMLESLWAKQTPERAKRMSEQMRTGVWQYAKGT
jgi:lysozyme